MEKKGTKNIILEDEKLNNLIRQLVNEAYNKGYSKTDFLEIINQVWKEKSLTQEENIGLTEDEKTFFEKVKAFVEHYKNPILEEYNKKSFVRFHVKITEDIKVTQLLNNMIIGITCMYIVLSKENTIIQKDINQCARIYFKDSYFAWDSIKTEVLKNFFHKLYICDTYELPMYSENLNYQNEILANEIKEFVSQYNYRNSGLNYVTMAALYVIQKYF